MPQERAKTMRRRILVAEDTKALASSFIATLEHARFEIATANDTSHMMRSVLNYRPALILFSVSSWKTSLQEAFLEMRSLNAGRAVRKVVLASSATHDDRISALDLGADDFLILPVSDRELLARLKAVLRTYQAQYEEEIQSLGNLFLHREGLEISIGNQRTKLSPREFRLLAYLMERPGHVVSRDELLDNLWYPTAEIEEPRVVDVYIWRLREKIEEDPARPRRLITRRGEGYSLIDPKTS